MRAVGRLQLHMEFRFLFPGFAVLVDVARRLYIVAFDLFCDSSYESLFSRLTTMGARQILERVWAVLAVESAREITRILRGFVEARDRVFVVEIGRDWASRHALFPMGDMIEPVGGPAQVLWRQRWTREKSTP
jgi:hypothetical protein